MVSLKSKEWLKGELQGNTASEEEYQQGNTEYKGRIWNSGRLKWSKFGNISCS